MRAPTFGAPIGELYAAAIDMCASAEDRGALLTVPYMIEAAPGLFSSLDLPVTLPRQMFGANQREDRR